MNRHLSRGTLLAFFLLSFVFVKLIYALKGGDVENHTLPPSELKNRYLIALSDNLTHHLKDIRTKAVKELGDLGEFSALPYLVDLLSVETPLQDEILESLRKITGKDLGPKWQTWAAWQTRLDIQVNVAYVQYKSSLYRQIDPSFTMFSNVDRSFSVPLRDIFWSGKAKDEIPALISPSVTKRREAVYLEDAEVVYGVFIAEQARAYPARIVDWHLIINDAISNRALCLVACPYSGILSAFKSAWNSEMLTFGNTGLIYGNNIVLYDHQTRSMWSSFTGEALSGLYAEKKALLEKIPVTQTTWREWRERFPDTTVLSISTGYKRDYGKPSPYFAQSLSGEDWFPTTFSDLNSSDRPPRELIYGIAGSRQAQAYLLSLLGEKTVVNGNLDGVNFLILTDVDSGSVRAYERGPYEFSPYKRFELRDQKGGRWKAEEAFLRSLDGGGALQRISGSRAFYASWMTWYPKSELIHESTRKV